MNKTNLLLAAVVAVMMTGCAKNDVPQPEEYDNLIVYGNIYTARVDESKDKNASERYVTADYLVNLEQKQPLPECATSNTSWQGG